MFSFANNVFSAMLSKEVLKIEIKRQRRSNWQNRLKIANNRNFKVNVAHLCLNQQSKDCNCCVSIWNNDMLDSHETTSNNPHDWK